MVQSKKKPAAKTGAKTKPAKNLSKVKKGINSKLVSSAGQFPYRRGLYEKPNPARPWTVRQYAGFSTARASNQFYQKNLAAGQTGLSVAFDLPTHRGFDSDDPRAVGDVGKAGVAICSVDDMKLLFEKIPLDKISVSMTMNGAVLPILAFYIVAAAEQNVPQAKLSGTIQNDILKEFLVRNTYIYPPAASMRIVADIIHYTTRHMPLFHPISISGYHLGEAGATILQELTFTLLNAIDYVKAALATGLKVDDFAPRLSFFFGIGMDFFMEVAKLRAARQLWAEIMKEQFKAKNPKSMMLRVHCQTSGVSLARQDPYNNVARTTLEAMAAVLGGTQSLHTNSFDEAIALPSELSARLARNTQLILQKETGIINTADPLGGSYYIEGLTDDLIKNCKKLMQQITEQAGDGGMVAAIAQGLPQRMIHESAVARQARLDQKQDIIVGVNDYQLPEEAPIDVLSIPSGEVLQEQTARLKQLRQQRDADAVAGALVDLRAVASQEKKLGLLEKTIAAARARATLGEISKTLEEVFTRHSIAPQITRGVYEKNLQDTRQLKAMQNKTAQFKKSTGRAPKILISKLGLDGHDRGAKLVAACFLDAGFDVVMAPLFMLPAEVAAMAIKEQVDIVGISTHTAGHNELVPAMIGELKMQGGDKNIAVVVGGIIPDQDKELLIAHGVSLLFDPGENINNILEKTFSLLPQSIGHNRPHNLS
ncbi:MAG: methylmalonyl-CoA mutase [Hydrotalea sp.]|nr:methylmalonyl-CoA mutase [Hydrotalea sp.]